MPGPALFHGLPERRAPYAAQAGAGAGRSSGGTGRHREAPGGTRNDIAQGGNKPGGKDRVAAWRTPQCAGGHLAHPGQQHLRATRALSASRERKRAGKRGPPARGRAAEMECHCHGREPHTPRP
ncbi:hypothetical protein GCM10027091_39950 [Streptomyces daliensis]